MQHPDIPLQNKIYILYSFLTKWIFNAYLHIYVCPVYSNALWRHSINTNIIMCSGKSIIEYQESFTTLLISEEFLLSCLVPRIHWPKSILIDHKNKNVNVLLLFWFRKWIDIYHVWQNLFPYRLFCCYVMRLFITNSKDIQYDDKTIVILGYKNFYHFLK